MLYAAYINSRFKDTMDEPAPNITSIEQPVSLKTHALRALKEAIITHQLKPGQFYTEVNLSEQLGVSRTPVREALISLESLGFLSIVRGRGFQINTWTPSKVSEIYLYRKMLEMTIIRIVAPKVTPDTIQELEALHQREIEAIESGDIRSCQLADRAIHLTLAAQTENTFLYSSMESIRDQIEWIGFAYYQMRPDLMGKFTKDHQDLIAALKKGDAVSSESLMSRHIDQGERESIKHYSRTR